MSPSENIYRSDRDVVDGLVDVEQFAEDFTNDSIDTLRDMMEDDQYDIYDYDDDGQPDMDQEYSDLYAYGPEWDCYHDCLEYPEDWG
jgi:hypothetical protein|tara:strand:+ start:1699 stop:1959 length:261 start_codon:yes stop_codon:yes gene_type:complete